MVEPVIIYRDYICRVEIQGDVENDIIQELLAGFFLSKKSCWWERSAYFVVVTYKRYQKIFHLQSNESAWKR